MTKSLEVKKKCRHSWFGEMNAVVAEKKILLVAQIFFRATTSFLTPSLRMTCVFFLSYLSSPKSRHGWLPRGLDCEGIIEEKEGRKTSATNRNWLGFLGFTNQ